MSTTVTFILTNTMHFCIAVTMLLMSAERFWSIALAAVCGWFLVPECLLLQHLLNTDVSSRLVIRIVGIVSVIVLDVTLACLLHNVLLRAYDPLWFLAFIHGMVVPSVVLSLVKIARRP